jgi:hypothetical protein
MCSISTCGHGGKKYSRSFSLRWAGPAVPQRQCYLSECVWYYAPEMGGMNVRSMATSPSIVEKKMAIFIIMN